MSNQQRLQWILNLINLKADSPFSQARKVLQENLLCRYILSFARSEKIFSLLTREEVVEINDDREASRLSLNRLRAEIAPVDKNLAIPVLWEKDGIIFPENSDAATGKLGQDLCMEELLQTVQWFQVFMAGCEAGRMDVGTLNEFKYTKGVILEFMPSRNPMNPDLSAAELLDMGDDIIERKILCHLIYPFLFSGQGQELSKVRRCRHCGIYFLSKRISATFCGSQCRGAFYYENSNR